MLFREVVYGLESIDEHVLEVDPVNHVETYILQDVSGNVVGAVDPNDEYHVEQFFDPYGLWERVTSIWTTINGTSYVTLDPDDGVEDTTEYMWTTTGLHGHFYDRESGLYPMRARPLSPKWQRFLSQDPIGTGLLPVTSLSYGGMPFAIDVAVNAGTQFTDGPNPYEFVRSNPITGRDPSGLFFTYADLGVSSAIQSNLAGQYLDVGASTVDAMKGVILWGNDRNATIDNLLGVSSNPFDTSGIDSALSIYNSYQSMQTALLGAAAVTKVVGLGKKLWARYVSRAGGRGALLEKLERGTNAQRRFFGFGRSRAAWTVPNPTKGWKFGDPINNLTERGTPPSWSVIRERFWMNEAHLNSGAYNSNQVARMRQGRAPERIRADGALERMELHHPRGRSGDAIYDFVPLWPREHADVDPRRHLAE